MKKILMGLGIVLMLTGAGCDRRVVQSVPVQTAPSVQSGSQITTSTEQAVSISRDDWQTYQNDQYGFKIQLPKTWSVVLQKNSFWLNPDVPGPRDSYYAPTALKVFDNKNKLPISEWFVQQFPKNKVDLVDFDTFRNDTGVLGMVWVHKKDKLKLAEYYFQKENKIFNFEIMDVQENFAKEEAMFNAIVNSFSFTKDNEYVSLEKDITGAGQKEKITLSTKKTLDGIISTLQVNDVSVVVPGYNSAGYFGIVDLDTRDKVKEIAVGDLGPSTDFTTTFYYYDGKQLVSEGAVQGLYEKMVFDGKGKLTTKTRGQILDTWFYDDDFVLSKEHKLVHVPKKLYTRDTPVTLLSDFSLQLSSANTSKILKLKKGEAVKIVGCDDIKWCVIERSNGERGWFAVDSAGKLNGTDLNAQDVFSGLSSAD